MSFVFFRRQSIVKFLFTLGMGATFLLFFIGYFAAYSARTSSFSVDKTYYFIIKKTEPENVAVWSETVYLDGGAGYVMEQNGEVFVALAAYEKKLQAESVAAALRRRGTECEIVPLSIGTFRFADRRRVALYEETEQCVMTALELADLFYRVANGLSAGEYTQRQAQSVLKESKRVLSGLRSACKGAEANRMLRACEEKCDEALSGVIYSASVRYMQLQLVEGVYSLQKVFSV